MRDYACIETDKGRKKEKYQDALDEGSTNYIACRPIQAHYLFYK